MCCHPVDASTHTAAVIIQNQPTERAVLDNHHFSLEAGTRCMWLHAGRPSSLSSNHREDLRLLSVHTSVWCCYVRERENEKRISASTLHELQINITASRRDEKGPYRRASWVWRLWSHWSRCFLHSLVFPGFSGGSLGSDSPVQKTWTEINRQHMKMNYQTASRARFVSTYVFPVKTGS